MIHIIGLGPGSFGQLTLEALNLLKQTEKIYLRTAVHPVVSYLQDEGIQFESFDYLYEEMETFDSVYGTIVDSLMEVSHQGGEMVYAVPGNPLCGEYSVVKLIEACKEKGMSYRLYSGVSFIDVSIGALEIDPVEGLKIIDAFMISEQLPDKMSGNLITQVYNQKIASEVKLELMEYYHDETEVQLIINGGVEEEQMVKTMPLYEIDRVLEINHLTTLYIPPQKDDLRSMEALLRIMKILRSPNGCAWDKKQSHQSLEKHLIEEAYELIDAIETGDIENMIEELGDLLFHVVFHAQIGMDEGYFSIYDVYEEVNKKLIRRHPHVFKHYDNIKPEEVEIKWEEIKKGEKGTETITEEMERIPQSFPALLKANKISSKAAKVGFDWTSPQDALVKVEEEIQEVKEALREENQEHIIDELGDLFFSSVNVARLAGVQPELALQSACEKFMERFALMESDLLKQGKILEKCSLDQWNLAWKRAKIEQSKKKSEKK